MGARPSVGSCDAAEGSLAVSTERPATYREVFGVAEFRGLYAAYMLSMVGDMLAKVAVSLLVFAGTESPFLSASVFALSYLPWAVGGPFLAALADRWPRRRVLIWCDAARAALVALISVPDVPWQVLLVVLLCVSLLAPPFEAARSALMPEMLRGDRFVVATGVLVMSAYIANVVGFVAGGALVEMIRAPGALLVDSLTFALSALLIWVYVTPRPPDPPGPRRSLVRETADGLRLVFRHRVLRSYLLLVWSVSALVVASEGLAAAYADHLGKGPTAVGLLLAALPLGMATGGLVLTRATAPIRRIRLAIPLATLATVSLLPLLFDPPLEVVLALYVVSGMGLATVIPLNAMFIRAVAPNYRGRAFGVARSGIEVGQGLAIVAAGAAATVLPVPVVIALFGGVAGTVLVALIALRWPTVEEQLGAETAPVGGNPTP
jgi:MFS family permease